MRIHLVFSSFDFIVTTSEKERVRDPQPNRDKEVAKKKKGESARYRKRKLTITLTLTLTLTTLAQSVRKREREKKDTALNRPISQLFVVFQSPRLQSSVVHEYNLQCARIRLREKISMTERILDVPDIITALSPM